MRHRLSQQGLSLLETMLVLAIAALLVVLSIRQYQAWQADLAVEQVKANVNAIFNAMTYYYRAQCRGAYDPGATNTFMVNGHTYNPYPQVNPGTLNPFYANEQTKNILNDLMSSGYLTAPFSLSAVSPVVDTSTYEAVFYFLGTLRRYESTANGNAVMIGDVYQPVMEVGVQLKATQPAVQQAYLRLLNATCLTSQFPAICPTSGTGSGSYVVWVKSPSDTMGTYDPELAQFNQLYNTYPLMYLTGTANSTSAPPIEYQGFICGP